METTYDNIVAEIRKKNCSFLDKYPPKRYIGLIKKYHPIGFYNYVSEDVKNICKGIIDNYNQTFLESFHKLILLSLICENCEKIYNNNLPEEVQSFYLINFERISEEIEIDSYKRPYLYSNDKFCKDLAVCSMRMIPAGAQKIHLTSLSRRFIIRKGARQFFKAMAFILLELKGFQPLFGMHTDSNDPHLMSDFNEEGWIKFYKRVAMIFKLNKKVKGIVGSSWFFDPVLEKISPRLSYLRRIVTDNGGEIFYLGTNEQSIRDSTLKSKTRKKLYDEGEYMPTSYLLIWPRNKLINWSEKID